MTAARSISTGDRSRRSRLRDESVDWVRRSLATELRDDSPELGTRAEGLVAIAEHYRIPIEALVTWIHAVAPGGKQWSGAEFRRFAEILSGTRAAVLQLRENDPWRQLCPACLEEAAHRVGSVWRCSRCGDVGTVPELEIDDPGGGV